MLKCHTVCLNCTPPRGVTNYENAPVLMQLWRRAFPTNRQAESQTGLILLHQPFMQEVNMISRKQTAFVAVPECSDNRNVRRFSHNTSASPMKLALKKLWRVDLGGPSLIITRGRSGSLPEI